MDAMPERDKFPREYFDGNPYEGETPEGAYRRIRWGNEPQEIFDIEAPEPLATIGDLAQLVMEDGTIQFLEHESPFVAVGTHSNVIYFVPKVDGKPMDIPDSGYEFAGFVSRMDYFSDKGGNDAYYYHDHEPPFPILYMHDSGVGMLVPSECEDGSRSYAVGDEGVIG
jgi:hypothetical protein